MQRRSLIHGLVLMPLFHTLTACSTPVRPSVRPFTLLTRCSGEKIATTAKAQVGRNYRYGGASPARGFDCSGLIYWSYAQHGVTIPRTVSQQRQYGQTVTKSRLRAGDIVFFRLPTGWHAGLMIDSERFVHAPSSGKKVRIDRTDNRYWKKYLAAARRILKS